MISDSPNIPKLTRDFLDYWGLRDRESLAAEPEAIVAGLDSATIRVLYAGIEEFLDAVSTTDEMKLQRGQLSVYLDPQVGQEHRWQLAAIGPSPRCLDACHSLE